MPHLSVFFLSSFFVFIILTFIIFSFMCFSFFYNMNIESSKKSVASFSKLNVFF